MRVVLLFTDPSSAQGFPERLAQNLLSCSKLYHYIGLPGTKVNRTAGRCTIVIQLQEALRKCKNVMLPVPLFHTKFNR